MTPQYILKASTCREPHCASDKPEVLARNQQSEIDNLGFAKEYAEPGYSNPKKGILFANWNYFPKGIDSILEGYGYAIEWRDEWSNCGTCDKAFRTSPNSYGWLPSYVIENECELTCHECIADNAGDYLESIEDNPRTALTNRDIDPEEYGYIKLEGDYENGFHPGSNDDPNKILKTLHSQGFERVIFRMPSKDQFTVYFECFYNPLPKRKDVREFLQDAEYHCQLQYELSEIEQFDAAYKDARILLGKHIQTNFTN
jgi:hypothetical protein